MLHALVKKSAYNIKNDRKETDGIMWTGFNWLYIEQLPGSYASLISSLSSYLLSINHEAHHYAVSRQPHVISYLENKYSILITLVL